MTHTVEVNEHRIEVIQRWNNFESSFKDQILTLIVSGSLEPESYHLIITLKKAIDTTHSYVERAFRGDPRLSLIAEEYKLIKVIYSLLEDYTPKGSHENLSVIYSRLNTIIAHRKRL